MSGPVERVLARLGERECNPRGNAERGWDARCPAHQPDRKPSFHLGEGEDGRALVTCHRGCSTDEICAALGLTVAGLFPEEQDNTSRNGKGKIVEVYPYVDEHGDPLFEVVRFDPKGFSQRRPDGTWGIKGVRRVLYRLPRVREAIKEGERVYVVEGERDVHALEALGKVATCNPMGAGPGKWLPEFSESLRGAEVVIVADRDEAGYPHAEAVRASLAGIAASEKVVEPIEGKGASDHLAAGRGLDEFVTVGQSSEEPETASDPVNAPALTLAQSRVDLVRMIDEGIPEREFVPGSGDALVKGKRHHVAAGPKEGKSLSVGIVLALDVVFAGGVVVVLDRENGADEYARRLESVLNAREATEEQREQVRVNYRYHAWPVLKLEWGADPNYAAAFVDADLVIFDSVRKFLTSAGLEENSNDDFSKFAEALVDPLMRAGIACVLLDNTGHEENRARGAKSKADLCDVMLVLKTTREFALDRAGRVEMTIQYSRFGELTGTWALELGDGNYGSWAHVGAVEARRRFRETVLDVLRESSPLGRDKLTEKLRDRGLKGTDETLRKWLAEDAAEGSYGFEHNNTKGYSLGVGGLFAHPRPPLPFQRGAGEGLKTPPRRPPLGGG